MEYIIIREFLEVLFNRDGYLPYIEIRLLPQFGNKIITKRYGTVSGAVDGLQKMESKGCHIYFGVYPRKYMSGVGDKTSIRHGGVLWVDIDDKRMRPGWTAQWVLDSFHLPPTMVVDTGGGRHAYWVLDNVCKDLLALERANYVLQQKLQSDSVHDCTRVLRLPGTINPKYGVMAKIVSCDVSRVYGLHEFLAPEEMPEQLVARRVFKSQAEDTAYNISDYNVRIDLDMLEDQWLKIFIMHGLAADNAGKFRQDRDNLDFWVFRELIKLGYSELEVKSVLTNPEWAISSKFLNLPEIRQPRYINRTYSRAYKSLVRG